MVIKVVVDIIVQNHRGQILLIKRKTPNTAFAGMWALPGGHVDYGEDLLAAALRELKEETGIPESHVVKVRPVAAFGEPGRDPRGHVISIAFAAWTNNLFEIEVKAGDDACDVGWFMPDDLPPLAFDHREIIKVALTQAYSRLDLK